MHYGSKAFSNNGQPTILVKRPGVGYFGNVDLRKRIRNLAKKAPN